MKTDFELSDDAGHGLALQADGKILVAGSANGDFALARYRPDGALDISFDGDGWVTADFADNDDVASAVVVQPDGKILVAGSTTLGKAALARYRADGSLDASFGTAGLVTVDFVSLMAGWIWSTGNAVALQPDGKIVVAGAWYWLEPLPGPPLDGHGAEPANDRPQMPSAPLVRSDFAMARLLANGQLDPDFGYNGTVITDFSGRKDVAYGLALQSDGRIILGGSTLPPSRVHAISPWHATMRMVLEDLTSLRRLRPDDSRFLCGPGHTNSNDVANVVALQADGRSSSSGIPPLASTDPIFTLTRTNTDGSLDLTLDGDDGLVVTDFGGAYDTGNAACLQQNQRIVVAGQSGGDIIVARYGILKQIFLPGVWQD